MKRGVEKIFSRGLSDVLRGCKGFVGNLRTI